MLNFGTKTVTIPKGRADGSFDPGEIICSGKIREWWRWLTDGDGKLDLWWFIMAVRTASGFYLGNGTGGFDAPQVCLDRTTPYGNGDQDLNLDGKPDDCDREHNSSDVSILRNKTQR